MKLIFSAVFLFQCLTSLAQVGDTVTSQLNIEEGNKYNLVFIDKNGKSIKTSAGNIAALGDISFLGKYGRLEVVNNSGKDIDLRLGQTVDGGFQAVKVLPLKAGDKIDFPFNSKGMFAKNDHMPVEDFAVKNAKIRIEGKDIDMDLAQLMVKLDNPNNPKPESNCSTCADQFNDYKKQMTYYDFECKCFYRLKGEEKIRLTKLSANRMRQFYVTNVNRYLYNVSIVTNEVRYESEMPWLLKNYFIGDSTGLLNKLMEAFSSKSGIQSTGGVKDAYTDFKTKLVAFKKQYNQLQALRRSALKVCNNFKSCCEHVVDFTLEELLENYDAVNVALMDLQLQVKDADAIKKMQSDLEQLKKELATCTNVQNEVEKLQKEKEAAVGDAAKAEVQKKIDEENKKCTRNSKAIVADINTREEELQLYTNIQKLSVALPGQTELELLYTFVDNIRKAHSQFITPPISPSGNRLEMVFKVTPIDTIAKLNLMPLYSDSVYYDAPVLFKPFVAFSSGTFAGLQTHLQAKTYQWRQRVNNGIADSSYYVLSESGFTPRPVGFGAFIHLETKIFPWLGVGPSVGVGLTIESAPRITYLGGGSIFLGDRKQLALSGGFAAISVNRLSNAWQTVASQQVLYSSRQALDYYKETVIGGFVAVSYTLFTTTKTSLSKSGK